MGKQTHLTTEKASGRGINPLRAALVKFERARKGTIEQARAFEQILRTLASHEAKSKCAKA
jgi:hypothetical protein